MGWRFFSSSSTLIPYDCILLAYFWKAQRRLYFSNKSVLRTICFFVYSSNFSCSSGERLTPGRLLTWDLACSIWCLKSFTFCVISWPSSILIKQRNQLIEYEDIYQWQRHSGASCTPPTSRHSGARLPSPKFSGAGMSGVRTRKTSEYWIYKIDLGVLNSWLWEIWEAYRHDSKTIL